LYIVNKVIIIIIIIRFVKRQTVWFKLTITTTNMSVNQKDLY